MRGQAKPGMLSQLKEQLEQCVTQATAPLFADGAVQPSVELEIPSAKGHGDFACNLAMRSAKVLHASPVKIAEKMVAVIQSALTEVGMENKIYKIEVKNPGFINFFLSPEVVTDILHHIFEQGDDFGRTQTGQEEKVQIEFVSANPTGPLSVAHARQAAVGDALGNILNFTGFQATKEYYVNDEGNQINILGRSIHCRAQEILGEKIAFPEEGYQGEYIKGMAQQFLDQRKITSLEDLAKVAQEDFAQFGVDTLLAVIRQELDDFGVHFDVWSHQSELACAAKTKEVLNELKSKGFLYEKDGALWFKSTDFGDDKDRVVKKSDGSYTYLAPDIAYHKNKFDRGFDRVVNIWGPDHHGYIPRLTAAIEALGHPATALNVLIVQLATIYRDGNPVSMSTRKGQYISLREVMDEVGTDAARFFFLMRHSNVHLDFDLELAKKETPENPVYYIQYAHARIHSIVKKAKEAQLEPKVTGFSQIREEEELDLIKKMGQFPDALIICTKQMDPFALVSYLMELANCFHRFYDCHRVVDSSQPSLSQERLSLIDGVRIVLANGLRLLGVNAPKRM